MARRGRISRWLARIAGWLGLGRAPVRPAGDRIGPLRRIVVHGLAVGLSPEEMEDLVADEMYAQALRAGGGAADIGLFGPRLFRRDAHLYVEAELVRWTLAHRPAGRRVPLPRHDADTSVPGEEPT